MMTALESISKSMAAAIMPPSNVNLREWVEEYRYLDKTRPDNFIVGAVPPAVKLYEDAANPSVNKLVLVAPTQLLKTEFCLNLAMYYLYHDPSPVLILTADDRLAETTSVRLMSAIESSPQVAAIMPSARSRSDLNKKDAKRMRNGSEVTILNINARSATISRPARVLIIDEVDVIKDQILVDSAENRVKTFGSDAKIIMVSSPGLMQDSLIWQHYMHGSQCSYDISCVGCGEIHKPHISHCFKKKNNEVIYICPKCHREYDSVEFEELKANGVWVSHNPEADYPSYHVHGLMSTFEDMTKLKNDYDYFKSKFDDSLELGRLVNFMGGKLGVAYDDVKDGNLNPHMLKRGLMPYRRSDLPLDIVVLTMAVDTQAYRLEYEICGWAWCYQREIPVRYGVEYGNIKGDPNSLETWDQLLKKYRPQLGSEKLNAIKWGRAGKKVVPVICMIDSGGLRTQAVYDFCRGRSQVGIFACKSKAKESDGEITVSNVANEKGDVILNRVPSVAFKNTIYDLVLAAEKNDSKLFMNFPSGDEGEAAGYNDKYYKGLSIEKRKVTIRKSATYGDKYVLAFFHENKSIANEPIDLAMLNYAAIVKFGLAKLRDLHYREGLK